jgi:LCP family protein required for cell wall assembly
LKPAHWSLVFLVAAIAGVLIGYILALNFKPSILPPALRFGALAQPQNILLLGVDIVYNQERRAIKADPTSFNGRSDTIMVAHLDPINNSICIVSIPRDTNVRIPGYGRQKINAANALGGPQLAKQTVGNLLNIPIDHYIILNVYGLVELVNEVGGINIDIPKRMRYRDQTAKLNIDLEPGPQILDGTAAMGFVRFRHDALGDIGRVQRQELFMSAMFKKALDPESWTHLPKLISIGRQYINTDLSDSEVLKLANFARGVPKDKQQLVLLPGSFSGNGDWLINPDELKYIQAKMSSSTYSTISRNQIKIAIENASSERQLGEKLSKYLRSKGYSVISVLPSESREVKTTSKIIAQKANPEDALSVQVDLNNLGEIVNASIGNIDSSVTIVVGEDAKSNLANVLN